MAKRIFYIALLFCAVIFKGYSQNTVITGNVKDAESEDPLPFVNISLKGTKHGTITDIDGNFSLNVSHPGDTLVVSYLGYKTIKRPVKKGHKQHFDISMRMVGIQLGEVVVMPGKKPEDILLDLIQERKKINKPKSLDYYAYDVYNKLEFDLNNISGDFGSGKLTKSFEFLKDYVDTANVSKKSFIPFFISESFSSIYYRKQPKKELEFVKANKISGINNQSLKRFTGDMYQDVDIYENVITVLGKGFISPLGNMGKVYYDYQLTDTSYQDNRWCYRLEFMPRRKHEPTIEGYVYINDTTFAVKGFEVSLSETANINFVDSLVAEKHYVQIEDSIWLIKKDRIFVDFNLVDTREGFFGRKTSYYSNHKINEKVDKSVFEKSYPSNLIYTDSVETTNKAFWEEKRPEKLSTREAEIYDMVDTIKTVKAFKRWETILTTIVTGYYSAGPVDLGPIYSYISANPIEGTRLRLGFKTNTDFSPKLKLESFGAYGFGDEIWKYGGGFTYMFDVLPRRAIHFFAAHDYLQMGDRLNALRTDNVLGTLLRRPGDIHMYMATNWDIHYEYEFIEGISLFAGMETNNILARPNHDFQIRPADASDTPPAYQTENHLQSTEFNIGLHLAPGEKFVRGKFNRISLGTKKPVINLNLGYAPMNYFSNQYEYLSVSLNYKHKIQLYPLGVLHYAIEGGKVFGTAPFPFLFVHKGNQSFAYYDYSFNLMNFYEFVSDTYMSIYAEHRFEGFFLSHIPLMRKLEWREHIGFKATYGQINENNKEVIVFPPHVHDFRTLDDTRELPYMEVNAGISNILKILRIDAVWRLSHLKNPNIYPFAVMAKLQIDF
ncbi:MAG: DUF5686 family protein [Bacteroidota bacterium]|nr:DUF5686 family protein [Bacteroidota bacterium]